MESDTGNGGGEKVRWGRAVRAEEQNLLQMRSKLRGSERVGEESCDE